MSAHRAPRRVVPLQALTAAEADRIYRKAEGTAAALYDAGKIAGERRPGHGRHGLVLYLCAHDCARVLGFAKPVYEVGALALAAT